MNLQKILFTLCLIVGSTAFATAPRGLAPMGKRLSKAEIAAAGYLDHGNYPSGYYTSENGDLTMRITKSGYVKPDFGIMLVNGTKAPMDFPYKLKFNEDEEVYKTRGETTVSWNTTVGLLTCHYPVSLEVDDLGHGDRIRIRVRFPQNLAIDAYGRCLSYGTNTVTHSFDRE